MRGRRRLNPPLPGCDGRVMASVTINSSLVFRVLIAALTLSVVAADHSTDPAAQGAPASIDLSKYRVQLLYSNDFSRVPKIAREESMIEQSSDGSWRRRSVPPGDAEWVAEGWGGAEVRDGKLRVAPAPFDATGRPTTVAPDRRSHMVVWDTREFPDDILIEFDMSPCGSTNGLALVLFCARTENGRSLFDLSLPPRRGDYKTY